MDVLMEIADGHLEGAMGKVSVCMSHGPARYPDRALWQEFIQRGICPDLSLGYHVTMSKSPAGFLRATNKRVVELSIVRQGARDGCKIRAFSDGAAKSADEKLNAGLFGEAGGSKRHRILA